MVSEKTLFTEGQTTDDGRPRHGISSVDTVKTALHGSGYHYARNDQADTKLGLGGGRGGGVLVYAVQGPAEVIQCISDCISKKDGLS